MEQKHAEIRVGYDLDLWRAGNLRLPLSVPLDTCPHWLLCGNSGSGKSYLLLLLLRNLLREYGDEVKLWVMDFKHSTDFAFLSGVPRFYTGADCAAGLEDYYQEFQNVRDGKLRDDRLRLLVFDEWAGFLVWETQQNKKQAEVYRRYLLEVLLMGRSIGSRACGVWVILQRNDAKYLDGRDQFFVTIALGKMNRDFKAMVLQGDELEQKDIYLPWEGILRMDGRQTRFLKVPKLRDPEQVKGQIRRMLTQASTAEGGGAPGQAPVSITRCNGTSKPKEFQRISCPSQNGTTKGTEETP